MIQAIILFSGGIDSTVLLAQALREGKKCFALSFDYGQRHRIELQAAQAIAAHYAVPQKIIHIDPGAFSKTALVEGPAVPKYHSLKEAVGVPSTQVPGRNLLFLAYAMGQAEILDAEEIHIGPNVHDFGPYPDCRPAFYQAFQTLASSATKQAVEGKVPQIKTPLIYLTKREIVTLGKKIHAPLEKTWTCYDPTPDARPCGSCLACLTRDKAFSDYNRPVE